MLPVTVRIAPTFAAPEASSEAVLSAEEMVAFDAWRLFLAIVVPLVDPTRTVAAAPPRFTAVVEVFARLNVVGPVTSPPSTSISPVTFKSFLTFVVPDAAPKFNVVAAPPKFTVVAVVFARLNDEVETVKSPPSIFTSPSTSRS